MVLEIKEVRHPRVSHSMWTIVLMTLVGMGVYIHPRIHQASSGGLGLNIFIALSLAMILASIGFWVGYRRGNGQRDDRPLLEVKIRFSHIIQTLAQSLVYIAWCQSWLTANLHIPLLIAQIAFAYLIDMALSWYRHHNYRLGLSPIPVVLSTNLFLFFKDDYFEWQWILIAFALLSKELFRWKREGRDVHIFNPSAIALSIGAVILISTETMHFTWGEMIARTHGFSPYSYEVIFSAGLLVSSFFTVGFTIVSATLFTLVLGQCYFEIFNIYRYLDTGIPIAVFLGMNLLVTDPVSSPWRRDSKVVYGMLYGLSVFILYGILRDLERPPLSDDAGLSAAFCDKLLAVPLLNLLSPFIDRWMTKCSEIGHSNLSKSLSSLDKRMTSIVGHKVWFGRLIFAGVWVGLFIAWVRPAVREHPGQDVRFWVQACEETSHGQRHRYACENRDRTYLRACESGALPACHNLALVREQSDPPFAIKLYETACEGGQTESCNHLGGILFLKGEESGDTVLLSKAEEYLERSCEQNIYEACTRRATLLRSQWLDRSAWTEQDWQGLWDLLNRSCDAGEPFACFELSQFNLQHPQSAVSKCQQGDQLMCIALKVRQTNNEQGQGPLLDWTGQRPNLLPNFKEVRAQLAVACGGSIQLACINFAWMLWRGDGGTQEQTRALKMMQIACDKGEKVACERLSWMRQQVLP